jgi:hypothetical protein
MQQPDCQDPDILAAHQANIANMKKLHKAELQSFEDIIRKHEIQQESYQLQLSTIEEELDS